MSETQSTLGMCSLIDKIYYFVEMEQHLRDMQVLMLIFQLIGDESPVQ